MRIGVDLMGSDGSPLVVYEATLRAAEKLTPQDCIVVLGNEEILRDLPRPSRGASLEFYPTSEEITMEDAPLAAARRKRESSLAVGIRLLAEKRIDAMVSAGNTGAMIACAALSLNMLPGIERPALLTLLPTEQRPVAVLDVGANIACKARHMLQFAHMGAAFQQCASGLSKPIVGLLNIGSEAEKGTQELREAYQALQSVGSHSTRSPWSFVGNIEGREAFQGKIDVLVTDGFTGNIFLKTAEGVASLVMQQIKAAIEQDLSPSVQQGLAELCRSFNYVESPGAILCGVEGIVVKCHGALSLRAMENAILGVRPLVEKGLIEKIKTRLDHQAWS